MKKYLFILIVCLLASNLYAKENENLKAIFWQKNYDSGIANAKKEKKQIFVHFYSDGCGYCVKMQKETFQSEAVIKFLNKKFVSIRVNTDEDPEIARSFRVFGLPTNYFLFADTEIIGHIPGFINETKMIEVLQKVNSIKQEK